MSRTLPPTVTHPNMQPVGRFAVDSQLLAVFYALLLFVIVAMIWSIRIQNRETQRILDHVAQMQRDVARFLGTDRR